MKTQGLLGEYKAKVSVNHDNPVEPRDNMKASKVRAIREV